ncbi:hypothetical protein [Paenibacillus macquariensis]|uniref:Uncharacterized protein n=1 Tax=Paenibacillus macquariensis TaxID=948756 RepID=A0ABY1JUR3_9BACL|nr:hypothetical protein [Paenibacillus macquariensis]MEC0090909.1 hypothetical protein [Paenibacillus macquariensis]OAB34638.1 hypothetical protein PMSM_12360 [Paenibacillus macquariensis subsp. macquariensis]SIQ80892.1 hypothetical protein SAMN05421578_104149 [Paenibacillus macquariensis]
MNTTIFFGSCDISDLLQYTCKILSTTGKRVLLVDNTLEQYIYYGSQIHHGELKLSENDGFEIAHGFHKLSDLEVFLTKIEKYDQVIIHCTDPNFLSKSDLQKFNKKYVAVNNERIVLEKTVEFLNELFSSKGIGDGPIQLTKLVVNQVPCNIAEDYLESVLGKYPIAWSDESYEMLFDEIDFVSKINNQHSGQNNINRLSRLFKKTLIKLSEEISGLEKKEIKSAFKQAKRRKIVWGK